MTDARNLAVDAQWRILRCGAASARLTPHECRLLGRLLDHAGRPVSMSALIDALYGGREDGGPVCANKVVCNTVQGLRRALWAVKAPVRIDGLRGAGYGLVAR